MHATLSADRLAAKLGLAVKLDRLLTRPEAADFLGVTPGTLAVWHSTGRHNLPVCHVGRSVRYRLSDLERWLAGRTRTATA